MDAERERRAAEIFDAVFDQPPEERKRLLDEQCSGDAELRTEVERLLEARTRGEALFEALQEDMADAVRGVAADESTAVFSESGLPKDRFGPYRILELLGEGGMGRVYLAEQEHPIRRHVALKVIKFGMATREVIARFEAERQALALMDHPCIAKVFDAGATADGQPYFVMEYVRGVPITTYCDTQKLTTQERLELFVQLCEGVQHAHQKAVLHRDLKPSNVLVTEVDSRPVPKIIDFGVAKATSQRLTEKTMFTAMGQLIGTFEYMSPEQAKLTAEDVDTRTDVYSLGVILYELLVGALPFESRDLRRAGFEEVLRVIREQDPPRLSTKLSTLGERTTDVATARRTVPSKLNSQLRGDLEWITMKVLEKNRNRRYGSAADLAADVQRHLRNEPVVAGPPSATYRTRKFVRRNRAAVVASSVVFLALLGGLTTATYGLLKATRARRAEAEQREQAEASAFRAQRVTEYLQGMLAMANPHEAPKGPDYTVREMLDEVARDLSGELKETPDIEATIRHTIGAGYRDLGDLDGANLHLTRALELRRNWFGRDDPAVAQTLYQLAWVRHDREKFGEGEQMAFEALDIRQRALGPEHQDIAQSMTQLGDMMRHQDKIRQPVVRDRVGELVRGALEMYQRLVASGRMSESLQLAEAMGHLGGWYLGTGQYATADSLFRESLAVLQRLHEAHPSMARCWWAMKMLRMRRKGPGDYEEAEAALQKAQAMLHGLVGEDHPYYRTTLSHFVDLYETWGKPEKEAEYRSLRER